MSFQCIKSGRFTAPTIPDLFYRIYDCCKIFGFKRSAADKTAVNIRHFKKLLGIGGFLDAATGKNAISQAKEFGETAALTGIVLTKLDGTAKGGIVITLADQFDVPVKFIGVGEGMDDLQEFDPEAFAEALFGN